MATLVTKKKGSDRWLSEVKGILALAGAGFGLVALATFDPALPPAVQTSPVGPVGAWLGWAAFQSFGYAGFLFPLLLGAWGASAFVRPVVARGWLPLAGLGVLLVAATGLLTQAAGPAAAPRGLAAVPVGGGLVGRLVTTALRAGIGDVGSLILLGAAVPIGVLLVTRVSYAAVVRVAGARLARLRRVRAPDAAPFQRDRSGSAAALQQGAAGRPGLPRRPPDPALDRDPRTSPRRLRRPSLPRACHPREPHASRRAGGDPGAARFLVLQPSACGILGPRFRGGDAQPS